MGEYREVRVPFTSREVKAASGVRGWAKACWSEYRWLARHYIRNRWWLSPEMIQRRRKLKEALVLVLFWLFGIAALISFGM